MDLNSGSSETMIDWGPLFNWAITSLDNFKQTQQQNVGGNGPSYYRQLCDGYAINIFLDTLVNNGKTIYFTNVDNGFDTIGRIKNWRRFLYNLLSYYSDVLNQLIVMPLPDLLTIARNPFPEGSGHEMKKVLLLLLGCAVQSDKKEEFINKIKELDVSLQEAIVNQIRKVTHDVDCVLNVQALELDPEDQPTTVVLHQLQRVIKERDLYANTILEMGQDQESDCSSTQSVCNGDVCARKLPESLQHVSHASCEKDKPLDNSHQNGVELADVKAKLRKLRQELDDKNEQLQLYKEDLEEKESKLNNLTVENLELKQIARQAKEYRDEHDILVEKAVKLERLEIECSRYKEKIIEMDFLKTRTNELKEENNVLWKKHGDLDSELEILRSKLRDNTELELELAQCQRRLSNCENQMKSEREKFGPLMDENTRLKVECQESFNRAAVLEKELNSLKDDPTTPRLFDADDGLEIGDVFPKSLSLSEQLSDSVQSKLLKLELENQYLRRKFAFSDEGSQEFKKENEDLQSKYTDLYKQCELYQTLCQNLEKSQDEISQEKGDLELNLKTYQQRFNLELDTLINENTTLNDEVKHLKFIFTQTESENNHLKHSLNELKLSLTEMQTLNESLTTEKQSLVVERKNWRQNLVGKDRLEEQLHKCKVECQGRIDKVESEKLDLRHDLSHLEDLLRNFDESLALKSQEILEIRNLLTTKDQECEALKNRCHDMSQEITSKDKIIEAERNIWRQVVQKFKAEKNEHSEELIDENFVAKYAFIVEENVKKLSSELNDVQNRIKNVEFERNQLYQQLNQKEQDFDILRNQFSSTPDVSGLLKNMEDKNLLMQNENTSLRQMVHILEEQIRKMQAIIDGSSREKSVLQQEVKNLNLQVKNVSNIETENCKLIADLRALRLQTSVLEQDNVELEKQCSRSEREYLAMRQDFETLQRQHAALLADQKHAQTLHDQYGADCEKLQRDVARLKNEAQQLRKERDLARDDLARFEAESAMLNDQLIRHENERLELNREFSSYVSTRNEHVSLRRKCEDLRIMLENSKTKEESVSAECRKAWSECSLIKAKCDELQRENSVHQHILQGKDIDLDKLIHKCDMLTQLTNVLEEENRTMFRQIESLMSHNQELSTRAFQNQQIHHTEEKILQEKLHDLRRHKEKLEEKIIEHYKVIDSPNKRKGKSSFIKKARAALIPKPSTKRAKQPDIATNGRNENFPQFVNVEGNNLEKSRFLNDRAASVDRTFSCRIQEPVNFEVMQNDQQSSESRRYFPIENGSLRFGSNKHRSNSLSHRYRIPGEGVEMESVPKEQKLPKTIDTCGNVESLCIEKISLAGSERGVDVPIDKNHAIQVSQIRSRSPPPYNTPRPMHKGQSVTTPITPARFPSQSKSNPSESRIPLTPVMTRRPPPPPYEKIGDCVKRDSHIFVPQQTSTPTSSCYQKLASSIFHSSDSNVFNPGNNSIESEEILSDDKLSAPSMVDHRATAKSRKNVPSFYENMIAATDDDADEENVHRLNDRDLTMAAASDVIPDSSRTDAENTVWYEYGCV